MGIGHSGLSGVKAATFELSAIGNNVANAGTVGFKKSMAEFADVMSGNVGGGVEVSDLRQTFEQGSIQGTGSTWDLAISGRGFFKVSEGGDEEAAAVKDSYYTRNGAFGVDANGFVVNSRGMRLHMYESQQTAAGVVSFPISTNTTEIQIDQEDSAAKATQTLTGIFNIDARVTSRGVAVEPSATDLVAADYTAPKADVLDHRMPVGTTFSLNGVQITATGSAKKEGTPPTSPMDPANSYNFYINGVLITPVDTAGDPVSSGTPTLQNYLDGISAKSGYTNVNVALLSGDRIRLTSTTSDIVLKDFASGDNVLKMLGLSANTGVGTDSDLEVAAAVTLSTLAADINLSGSGVTATIKDHPSNSDISYLELTASDPITIIDSQALTVSGDGTVEGVGGGISFTDFTGLGSLLTEVEYSGIVDPTDDLSYDHSVTSIMYDTLGAKQALNTYFQKISSGHWEVFTQRVDSLGNAYPSPATTSEKVATLIFSNTGALEKIYSARDEVDPGLVNAEIDPENLVYDAGVLTSNGVKINLPQNVTPTGSDLLSLDIEGTNQFAGKFRIIDLQQDGYASGALTGVEVDELGIIRASYSNGNTTELGKVALFEFNNNARLRQEGGVLWAETNGSGAPRPGEPGESIFGRIKSQSLESSSVDVTSELVNLITAQRNFQANSKMISASKEMNQVVMNI